MQLGQAVLAALPAGLAIIFEIATPVPENKIQRDVRLSMLDAGVAPSSGPEAARHADMLSQFMASFAVGTTAIYSVRPTIVSVVSASLAVIYEFPGQRAFFGAAALVVILLIMLPAFARLENASPIDVSTILYVRSRFLPLLTARSLISILIIVMNLSLIALCYFTYHFTSGSCECIVAKAAGTTGNRALARFPLRAKLG
jgi:hypothetical protein